VLQPLVEHFGIACALKQHGGNQPPIMVTPDQAGARAQICIVGAFDPPANGRSPPKPAGAGGKASFIQIHDRLIGLLGLVVALDKVFTPGVTLGLEGLGVEQRFFYG